ncbi:MAG: AtpZ/AtpI family protein [Elusimicrobiota bacterium]|nr:AtpZ/AtpI family protein [Elusimicrobiota bacterium]
MEDKDNYWKYAQIGLELAVSVMVGFWGGYWLDKKLGSAPWLMLLGAAAGMAGGFYLVIRELFEKKGGGIDK